MNEESPILLKVIGAKVVVAVRSSMYYGPTSERHQLPYGWCFDHGSGQTMKQSEEQKIIDFICQMRDTGISYNSIATCLNQASITTRYGNIWRDVQVRRIISRNLKHWKEIVS